MLATTHGAKAQLAPGEHGCEFVSSDDGTTQPYRLFIPKAASETTRPLPLVVVLHGWGVDEHAWFKFTPVKRIAEEFGYVIAAPYGRGNWWYRGPAERDVLDVVGDVRRHVRIDPRRVYLTGHSMGGWGTWHIGLRHPDVFAAIAPMAGFDPREEVAAAAALHPYVVHDALDPIVPVAESRQPAERMSKLGISHVYREPLGYGHASRMIGDHLPDIFRWFAQHPRELKPWRLALASRTGGMRDRWLALVKTAEWPRLGVLDAYVDSEGAIVATPRNVAEFAIHADDLPASAARPLRLRIGDEEVATSASTGWLHFACDAKQNSWKATVVEQLPAPTPLPPLRGPVAEQLVKAHAEDRLATAVAEILRAHLHAECCVLDADKVRIGKGALTVEKLLDAWVYPEDRLIKIQISPSALANVSEVISKGKALVVPADVSRSHRKEVTVVSPLAVARQAKWPQVENAKPYPFTLGELLAALATNSLPAGK